MKGKWAEGITPRNFSWIIPDKLAACERPGGYGDNHRRVRRQEEIVWLHRNNFGLIFSLCEAPHNLHNYDAVGLDYEHHPWPSRGKLGEYLVDVEQAITSAIEDEQTVLIHKAGVGDEITGMVASYLLLSGMVKGGPRATAITERIFSRQLGPSGRAVVEAALRILSSDSGQA